jgi:hypothetical protein
MRSVKTAVEASCEPAVVEYEAVKSLILTTCGLSCVLVQAKMSVSNCLKPLADSSVITAHNLSWGELCQEVTVRLFCEHMSLSTRPDGSLIRQVRLMAELSVRCDANSSDMPVYDCVNAWMQRSTMGRVCYMTYCCGP